MTTRAALYARLSRDRSGQETATARQLADCRAFAQARGWEVIAEYTDADVSAYKRNTSRPGYEALLADLDAGRVDVIVSWKLDRLLRRILDFETLWQRAEPVGAHVATVRDGIDTSAPMVGVLLPRLMSIFAEMESANLSIREKRKHEDTARLGKRSGGGHRPFGLTRDWSGIVADEAAAIREAVERIIGGESMYAIVKEWNARGLRTPTGKEWAVQHFRSMARSPRLAGARRVGDELVITGEIPAIITGEQHHRLLAAVTRPQRNPAAGKALLAGLARCGVCGSTLVTRRRHTDRVRYYACEKGPGKQACGHVHITAEATEELAAELALAAIDSPELALAIAAEGAESDADGLRARVRDDEASLAQLTRDHYVERILPRAAFLVARDELEARIAADRRLLERQGGSMLASVLGAVENAREQWNARDIEWRRAFLASVLDRLEIMPKGKANAGRFDPERVRPVWRY